MIYSELYQYIIDYTENQEPTFLTTIPFFVMCAEEEIYRSVNIPPQSKDWTGTSTVGGNNTVSLPSDFLNFDYVSVIDLTGAQNLLLNKEIDWIYQAYPLNSTQSIPLVYANKDNTSLVLGPTPDQVYALKGRYVYTPTSIVTAGNTGTWIGTNAQNALLYGTLCQAYTYMKGEQALTQQYLALYQEALEKLKKLGEGHERSDQYRNPTPRPIPLGDPQ